MTAERTKKMFNVSPKSSTSPEWKAYDDISLHIAEDRILSDDALKSCSEAYRTQYQLNRQQWYVDGEYSDPEGNYWHE